MNQLHKLISATALAVLAYGPSAHAQEEDRKVGKKFPIRTQPLLNRKSLAIPKKLPTLQAKKAGRGGPERFKPRKTREAPPVRLTAPPRGGDKEGTSFADIKKASGKHGGSWKREHLERVEIPMEVPPESLLALDQALAKLEQHDARCAEVVRLRFFGGLSEEEVATALEVSTRTVQRDWSYARARLMADLLELEGDSP